MYGEYFLDGEIKSEFLPEYISLWPGWLGKDRLHELDEVVEADWNKFNNFIRLLGMSLDVWFVDRESETIGRVEDIESTLSTFETSMSKTEAKFSRYVLPSLSCVIAEEWDYTYILWHKGGSAVEQLQPLIAESGLYSFADR